MTMGVEASSCSSATATTAMVTITTIRTDTVTRPATNGPAAVQLTWQLVGAFAPGLNAGTACPYPKDPPDLTSTYCGDVLALRGGGRRHDRRQETLERAARQSSAASTSALSSTAALSSTFAFVVR